MSKYTVLLESTYYHHPFRETHDCDTLADARRVARQRMRYCRNSLYFNSQSWRDYVKATIVRGTDVVEFLHLSFTGQYVIDVL